MAYQSKHTGTAIDAGIDINDTQNSRLTALENKVNTNTSNINTNTNNIQTLQNKIIPISQGGTGATSMDGALTNLGIPHFYSGTEEPASSLGKVNDIYFKTLSTSTAVGSVWNYSYTGGIQSLVIPETGVYKLEISGARGGTQGSSQGGSGGTTTMHSVLSKGQTIYICCGGVGGENSSITNVGGYNGGGYSGSDSGGRSCGGGGCTHIATMTGTLAAIGASNLSTVLCVAGGGGGGVSAVSTPGGAGGGITGGIGTAIGTYNSSTYLPQGGTQTGPGYAYGGTARQGAFGRGRTSISDGWGGGGGGGLYGGGNGYGTTGSGGSGYIASSSTTYNGVTYQNGTVSGQNYGVGIARVTLVDAISGGIYLKTTSGWIRLT